MFCVRDRLTCEVFEVFETLQMAEECLWDFEVVDKIDGKYAPNRYEIVEED